MNHRPELPDDDDDTAQRVLAQALSGRRRAELQSAAAGQRRLYTQLAAACLVLVTVGGMWAVTSRGDGSRPTPPLDTIPAATQPATTPCPTTLPPDDTAPADGPTGGEVVDGEVVDGGPADGEVVDGEVVDRGPADGDVLSTGQSEAHDGTVPPDGLIDDVNGPAGEPDSAADGSSDIHDQSLVGATDIPETDISSAGTCP